MAMIDKSDELYGHIKYVIIGAYSASYVVGIVLGGGFNFYAWTVSKSWANLMA